MKHESNVAEMQGAYSAIFTPFDHWNQINFDMLTSIANFQIEQGLKGFFVTGSTGEGLLLSYEERLAVIKHVAEISNGRATVVAHVGHGRILRAALSLSVFLFLCASIFGCVMFYAC